VFFDLRKASTLPHRTLLEKLKQLNLNPVLIKWICSYLMGRRQKVVVDGESFGTISVDSGVPQGSAPSCFLYIIDDIVNTSLSPGSKISLHADDMMLFKIINSNADYIDLQNDIDGLNYWVTAPQNVNT